MLEVIEIHRDNLHCNKENYKLNILCYCSIITCTKNSNIIGALHKENQKDIEANDFIIIHIFTVNRPR